MTFKLDLSGQVPLYGQEHCNWCGAASGQMILNGYPAGSPHGSLFFPQWDVWNTIQAHNSTVPADVAAGWATDPTGLAACLQLKNQPQWGWDVFQNPNRDQIMFNILWLMAKYRYPVAALINYGGHWVVIVGYESDASPLDTSTPQLLNIDIHDPEPHNFGSILTLGAGYFYQTLWAGPVVYQGSWGNDYVAIIEPPESEGRIQVKEVGRIGTKIIGPEKAIDNALAHIKKLTLTEKHAILKNPNLTHLEPIVVHEEFKPLLKPRIHTANDLRDLEKEKKAPRYYVVPFGFKGERGKSGEQLARVGIIINAYTGNFEEIAHFGKPVRYLPREDAINIATRALGLKDSEVAKVKADLMFQPSDISHIRAYPFWAITIGERVIYVDQLGTIYKQLTPSVPGD